MADPRPNRVRNAEETILDLHAEVERLRATLTADALEPIVTKAKGNYIRATVHENYTGYEERYMAEYISQAIIGEQRD